jgi:glycosyltransferase involved in cell wall biosynthesis
MNDFWLIHPTGNNFVRALLAAGRDEVRFFTSFGLSTERSWPELLPKSLRSELKRRTYDLPRSRISTFPFREGARVLRQRLFRSPISVDPVYQHLDRKIARLLERTDPLLEFVYSYEDGALETFRAAKRREVKCVYDLPIAYWQTAQKILGEEADRLPDWEPTLVATCDSPQKLARKSEELELADVIICPSKFVYDSLPAEARASKSCVISPFGSPEATPRGVPRSPKNLRVLFAGSMTQRKGLADVFKAVRLLRSNSVELIVMGTPLLPSIFYRKQCPNFRHEPPRSNPAVLELMQTCDLLVLPSLVEGRALVQQEALACGLPIIITPNTGGEDLIEEGTGFLVPIRSPEKIAEKIDWFASNRPTLESMRGICQRKAAEYTWQAYAAKILSAVRSPQTERPGALV